MQLIQNNGNQPKTFILLKCASATWREGRLVLLLADARSGWSIIRWRQGVTCAVTGRCAQWAGFHQPVSEAVISPSVSSIERMIRVSGWDPRRWVMMRRSDWFSAAPRHRCGEERDTPLYREERLSLRYFCLETEQLRFWTDFMVSAFCLMSTWYILMRNWCIMLDKMDCPAQDWRIYVQITWGTLIRVMSLCC